MSHTLYFYSDNVPVGNIHSVLPNISTNLVTYHTFYSDLSLLLKPDIHTELLHFSIWHSPFIQPPANNSYFVYLSYWKSVSLMQFAFSVGDKTGDHRKKEKGKSKRHVHSPVSHHVSCLQKRHMYLPLLFLCCQLRDIKKFKLLITNTSVNNQRSPHPHTSTITEVKEGWCNSALIQKPSGTNEVQAASIKPHRLQ